MSFIKQFFSLFSSLEKKEKKLHLVLDLDHTLVHSISVSGLSKRERYLIKKADSRVDLWRFEKGKPNEHLIKLRPFLHQFLKEANKIFHMHVYTMGSYSYAQRILSLIDPDKVYFGDRVITKEKSPPRRKTLDLISADQRRVVIVDDTSSVWGPQDKRNLLKIPKYFYFRDGLKSGESYAERKLDEGRSRGALSIVLKLLQKGHRRFERLEYSS